MATIVVTSNRMRVGAKRVKRVIEEALREAVVRVAGEVVQEMVMRTPVKTGRARGGYRFGLKAVEAEDSEVLDPSGMNTVRAGKAVVGAYPRKGRFPRVAIANAVPYIGLLERGHSWRQAPNGMVKPMTIAVTAKYAKG